MPRGGNMNRFNQGNHKKVRDVLIEEKPRDIAQLTSSITDLTQDEIVSIVWDMEQNNKIANRVFESIIETAEE
jgi:hypothetical protein